MYRWISRVPPFIHSCVSQPFLFCIVFLFVCLFVCCTVHAFFEEFEKTKALSLRVQNLQPAARYVHDKVEDKAMVVTAALTGPAVAVAAAGTAISKVTSAIATSTEHRNASLTSEYSQTSGRERDHPPLITTTTATASNISINRAVQSTQRLLNALHASRTKTAFDLWNEPKREIPPAKASNHLLPQREIAMRQVGRSIPPILLIILRHFYRSLVWLIILVSLVCLFLPSYPSTPSLGIIFVSPFGTNTGDSVGINGSDGQRNRSSNATHT